MIVCGISTGFPVLFPTPGQITHVLLTRAPLYSGSCPRFLVRLACVRHAASVDSEPGSNSRLKPEICSERTNQLSAISSQRSEEHTSELQSPCNLVCRLLLEKKKTTTTTPSSHTMTT